MVVVGGEVRDGRQYLRDRGAGRRHGAVAKGIVDEGPGLLVLECLLGDDAPQLLLALGGDERAPLFVDLAADGEGVDELLDEVPFAAQAGGK